MNRKESLCMKNIFGLSDESIVYVLCPANNKTGGTELLHQLVYQLNKIGREAYIVYYFEGEYNKYSPTPTEFCTYISQYKIMSNIIDNEKNLLILPEVCIGKGKKFKKLKKSIWWLSVDNYKQMRGKIKRLKEYGVKSFLKHILLNDFFDNKDLCQMEYHLCQSFFAETYLLEQGVERKKIVHLSDYVNDLYLKINSNEQRENIVLYNPKKGLEFTKKIIQSAPNLQFIPIINMTNLQINTLMCKAKVYIDFGNHPGKDRLPREATMSGCCIITNNRGAARFYKDVSIDDRYKIEDVDSNINRIIATIKSCLDNYEIEEKNFSKYRALISNEKEKFIKDVYEIFT